MYATCKRCNTLIPYGDTYCANHKRASTTERMYDHGWVQLSRQLRKEQPWCSICRTPYDLTVDHINGNKSDRRRENLRVLCRGHNTAHRNRGNRLAGPRRG